LDGGVVSASRGRIDDAQLNVFCAPLRAIVHVKDSLTLFDDLPMVPIRSAFRGSS